MPLRRRRFVELAALGALAGFPAARTGAADSAPVLHLLEVPTDGAKSVLYAQHANLFRKYGLQTEIVAMNSGAAIFSAIVGGSAEIGSGSLFPVFSAYVRGVPLRIIAAASLYRSDHADALLLVKKDGPIREPRDLNGKIIGADTVKDVNGTATRAWLDAHGGDQTTLKVVELRPTEQLGALEAGRIDAVVLKPPYLTIALESGSYRVLGKPLDAIGRHFLLSCWVATVDFIAKNADVVNRFAKALGEAERYTNANQAETVDLVAAFTGQDPALLRRGIRSTSAETIALSDVQMPIDFAYKYGIIDRRFDAREVLYASVPVR